MAVEWLLVHVGSTPATIFCDSLSVIKSLKSPSSSTQPSAMCKLLSDIDKLEANTTFVWIPSHVKIRENDEADNLAKQGATRPTVDICLPRELKEEYVNINEYCQKLWQEEYNASNTGQAYRTLEPLVSNKVKFTSTNQNKERVLTRLRLGKCSLKKYLFDIKCHIDGLCTTCRIPEIIEHFLLE